MKNTLSSVKRALLATVLLGLMPLSASGATVINETFSSSPAANFTAISGGTWAVSGGRYVISDAASGTILGNISLHNTEVTGDYTLTTTLRITGSPALWNDAAVVFNYIDASNYYFASFNESNDGATNGIMRVQAGVQTELADFNALTPTSKDYEVEVARVGSTITVKRNGTVMATVSDPTFTGGRVGYGTKYNGARFDNLVVNTTHDTQPPTAPTGLTGAGVSSTQINLSWNRATDNGGVTGYLIYRDGALLATVTGTTYNDTGLTPLTSYSYKVKARDAASNLSADSNIISVATPSDTEAPNAPLGLNGTAASSTQINLSWNAATDNVGVTGYRVYRDGALLATVTGTNYNDTGLTPLTSYSYKVKASDAAGNLSADSNTVSVATPSDTEAPTAPTNLNGAAVSSTQIHLRWNAATDNVRVTGYEVYRDGALIATVTGTSHNDTGLTASTNYSYKVKATDAASNRSADSNIISVTTFSPNGVPVEVSSFGPNGTHWPSLLPTPFLYDTTVPNVIDVACTWSAINTALTAVTPAQAAAGVLLRVAPGDLPGNGSGAGSTPVLQNLGSTSWVKRVTVAPRDGYGTVTIGVSNNLGARFHNVNGVCFAGFVASSLRTTACVNSALAWCKVTNWLGVSAATNMASSNMELVEVVLPVMTIEDNDSAQCASSTNGPISGFYFTGCYFAPTYRASGSAHSDTLQFFGVSPYFNMVLRDSALFSSSNCAVQTGDLTGLELRHCYIAAQGPALSRYPFPTGYTPPNTLDATKTFNGGGSAFTTYDSIFIGRMPYSTSPWSVVSNTRVTEAVPLAPGGVGSWTVDPTLASSVPEDFGVALPTDTYLNAIWRGANTSTDTEAPTAPTGLNGTAVSSTQINLSWNASTDNVGVTGYQVYRDGSFLTTVTSTTYNDTGLTASTNYSYTVKARDAANNLSADSNIISVTTTGAGDTEAPTAPTGLNGTAVSSSQINLSWNAATDNVGVTGYQVYRNGALLITVSGTIYNDTGLTASTSYSYKVKASDAANNLSADSNTISVTTASAGDTQAPTAPTDLIGTAVSSAQINLGWNAATDNVGVTDYQVYRDGVLLATITGTNHNDTGLSASTSYSYKVRARDAANNISPDSNTISVTTLSASGVPVEVASFGPNGTHWPSLLPTPFLYDKSVPNIIDVACTWSAIKTALAAVTPSQAAAGVLIRVAPGDLPGNGSGSTSTPVLQNLGSTAWTKRVTVAPRDGYGTVTIGVDAGVGARIHNVHGVCFAGFIASSLRPSACVNSAIAWTKVITWLGVSASTDMNSSNMELVEVVLPVFAVEDNDSAQCASSTNGSLDNFRFIACYIAPTYRTSGTAHTDTLQFFGSSAYTNMYFRDCALFASSNCAIQTGDLNGLELRHCYIAAGDPALSRYPFPLGYTPPNNLDVTKTFNGGGSNFKTYDSIFIGRMPYSTPPWTMVSNTRVTEEAALAPGGTGSWTVDPSLATSVPEDYNVTLPTDEYLNSIWQ